MKIDQILKESMSGYTGKQKRIADFMLSDLNRMSYITLKELSRNVGCTEVTILNFCKKLGFSTFADMKNAFRANQMQKDYVSLSDAGNVQFPMNGGAEVSLEKHLDDVLNYEKNSIAAIAENLDYSKIKKIAQRIVDARIVYTAGRGTSMDVADFFRRRLSSIGLNAQLINPEDLSSVQSALNKMSKDDVFLFITYPLYYSPIVNIAEIAQSYGSYTAAITDKEGAAVSKYCDDIIATGKVGGGYYYSFSHAMIYASIIITAVQYMLEDGGQAKNVKDYASRIGPPDFLGE